MDDFFSFEKLDIYQRALLFAQKIQKVTKGLSRNFSWCDQINRAAMSIVLNIAEGAGRRHNKDKRNFYYIARGSAFECVPLIELGISAEVIAKEQHVEYKQDLKSICQMLTKLIQSTENEEG